MEKLKFNQLQFLLVVTFLVANASADEFSEDIYTVHNHHIGVEFGNDNTVVSYNNYTNNFYASIRFDSNEYVLDSTVSVCNDGGVSGSTGSGTCSGHGGVSHTRKEKAERFGGSFGYLWNAVGNFYLGGGAGIGSYISEVDVGNEGQSDYYINLEARTAYRFSDRFSLLATYDFEVQKMTVGAAFGF